MVKSIAATVTAAIANLIGSCCNGQAYICIYVCISERVCKVHTFYSILLWATNWSFYAFCIHIQLKCFWI